MLRRNVSRLTKEGALGAVRNLEIDRYLGRLEGRRTKEQRSGFEVVRDCFTEGGDSVVGIFCLELLRAKLPRE